MNVTRIALAAVLVAFADLTAYAVWQHGFVGFFQTLLASPAGITALVDLTIALSLVLFWMVGDARDRGVFVLPYVVLTLALGSVGPLLYLVVTRKERTFRAAIPATR